jgi:hypothetical protein
MAESQNQGRRGLPGSRSLSFASPKESNQRKGDPRFAGPFGASLRYSTGRAAAQLALFEGSNSARGLLPSGLRSSAALMGKAIPNPFPKHFPNYPFVVSLSNHNG